MTTPLFLLRCVQLGISIADLDLLTIGLVNDRFTERYEYSGWFYIVSAKYCYAAHESRLHQNDRCKRFALCLVLTVRFRSLAPWGKLFQLFI